MCARAPSPHQHIHIHTHTNTTPLTHAHTHTRTRAHTHKHTHTYSDDTGFLPGTFPQALWLLCVCARADSRRRSCVHVLVHAWARARSPPQLTTIELTLQIDTIEIPRDTIEIPRDTTEIPRKTVTRMQIERTQQTDSCIQGCTSLHRQTDRCTDR